MMALIYYILVHLAYVVVLPVALFSKKIRLWVTGRFGWRRKIKQWNCISAPVLWFHAASLGEFEQGLPLMEAFKEKIPGCKLILTFYSSSGYEVRKKSPAVDYVSYLPLDTPYNAARLIQTIRPSAAFFIKYEFWYFFLKELNNYQIPSFLVSGIFRPNQVFFKWYGRWFSKNLSLFNTLFVQDIVSAELAAKVTQQPAVVAGDTRFDRVLKTFRQVKQISLAEKFAGRSLCLVAGSTWPRDEELLIRYINQAPQHVKLIIAPHEIEENHITRLEAALNVKHIRYNLADADNVARAKVLIVDNIGLLSSLYRYGQIAYVGGGFGKGIHNILEASVYGMPVVIGPQHTRFREATELIKAGAAFPVENEAGLMKTLNLLTENNELRYKASSIAATYVQQHAGATKIILETVLPRLQQKTT